MMRSSLMPVFAFLLVLSACGSGDAEGASSDGASNSSETTTVATTEVSVSEAPTTEAPATTAASADSEYCQLSRAADQLDADFTDVGDPAALETYFVGLIDLVGQAVMVAPDEIASDLATIEAQIVEVGALVADGGYTLSSMVEAVSLTESDETDAASRAVDAYDEAVCGIPSSYADSDETAADDQASNGLTVEAFEEARRGDSTREAMIEGMRAGRDLTEDQAGCFIDNVSPELFVALGNGADPSDGQAVELLELLELCEIPLASF